MKRIVVFSKVMTLVLSVGCLCTVFGCQKGNSETGASYVATEETITEAIETSNSSSDTDITSELTTTNVETEAITKNMTFEDYLDDVENLAAPIYINKLNSLDYFMGYSGGYYFPLVAYGYDNEVTREFLKNKTGDGNATIDNVNYYQEIDGSSYYAYADSGGGFDKFDFYNAILSRYMFDNVIRYILEENNLRMWVDEIPASYIKEKFPEQYEQLKNNIEPCSSEIFPEDAAYAIVDGNIASVSDKDLKLITLYEILWYNSERWEMAEDYTGKCLAKSNFRLRRSKLTGGVILLPPNETVYNKMLNDFEKVFGYSIDPYKKGVETKERLVETGADLQVAEYICNRALEGGAKSNLQSFYPNEKT